MRSIEPKRTLAARQQDLASIGFFGHIPLITVSGEKKAI